MFAYMFAALLIVALRKRKRRSAVWVQEPDDTPPPGLLVDIFSHSPQLSLLVVYSNSASFFAPAVLNDRKSTDSFLGPFSLSVRPQRRT